MRMRILSFLLLFSLLSTFIAEARVLVVDPFGEVGVTFPTFPLAYTEAVNGDTIEVRPFTPQGGVGVIDKDLTIVGHGYYLGMNYGGIYQPNNVGWGFSNFKVTGAAIVEIIGLNLSSAQIDENATLLVMNSKINHIYLNHFSEVNIHKSLISQVFYQFGTGGSNSPALNTVVRIYNSVIDEFRSSGQVLDLVVTNCIVGRFWNGTNYGVFTNCIISPDASAFHETACDGNTRSVRYSVVPYIGNVCDSTNTHYSSIGDVFAGGCHSFQCDSTYYLMPNSPAIGAGYNGVDCGIFGGPTPYVLSGLPSRPWVYEFMAPPAVSQQNPAAIEIKVKAID